MKIEPNDIFFICSHELATKVSEKEMMRIILDTPYDPIQTCQNCVKMAEKRGGQNLCATALYCIKFMGLDNPTDQKTKLYT